MRYFILPLLCLSLIAACSKTSGILVSDIYYRLPETATNDGKLTRVHGGFPTSFTFGPNGFDLQYRRAVYADGDRTLVIVNLDGRKQSLKLESVFQVARPSFSWDGAKIVFQARENTNEGQTEDINIYVVTLVNKFLERVGTLSANEESPEWFWNSNKIAYYSYGATPDIHVYDLDAHEEVTLIANVPGAHIAISKDGEKLLAVSGFKLYDVPQGRLLDDLSAEALSGLKDAGYELDTRFPGKANGGTFPLGGDFSPDGKHLVLDGAVKRGADYGVLLFQMTLEGTDFKPLKEPVAVDPSFSENHRFSLFHPRWL